MRFDFSTAGRILFGEGSLTELAAIAPGMGKRPVLVISGSAPASDRAKALLEASGFSPLVVAVKGEPTVAFIQEAAEAARKDGCNFVVAVGGGSALDAGKALAAALSNPGDLTDYLEVVGKKLPLPNAAAPVIAIPTTAGTGSEVTRNAVLSVPEKGVKVSLRHPSLLPRVAIVDPELTWSVPPNVTAATGMDALTQVIEPYVSVRANGMTDLYCREGIQRAARSLKTAYRDGSDRKARSDMAMVSLLGGLALANAGLGAVHGFAAPLGGRYYAPHGAICARLLPVVCRVNINALVDRDPQHPALRRYQQVARILTGDDGATAWDGVHWLEDLVDELRIPALSNWGVRMEEISELVDKAAGASSMQANPLRLTDDELALVLEQSI